MDQRDTFDGLIVSAPNTRGALFFVVKGAPLVVDVRPSTGLSISDGRLLRGIQMFGVRPERVVAYAGKAEEFGEDLGILDLHDVFDTPEGVYVVSTHANAILHLSRDMRSVVRQWAFPGEGDAWHINSIVRWNGRIVFSAFGEFEFDRGYKGKTHGAGFVRDLTDGAVLIKGLSQPHSLTVNDGRLLIADSESRRIMEFDESGVCVREIGIDGYPRGIAVRGRNLYVGVSRTRNVDTPGVECAQILALDLESWELRGRVELPADEIYDIRAVQDDTQFTAFLQVALLHGADYTRSLEVVCASTKDELKWSLAEIARLKATVSWKITRPVRAFWNLGVLPVVRAWASFRRRRPGTGKD